MTSGGRGRQFASGERHAERPELAIPSLRWPEEEQRDRALAERALRFWLWVAAAVRLWQVAVEPAVLHPDALGQALEPAFRAAFGHGEVAWEWREGLRSWAWPLLLSPAFWLARGLGAPEIGVGMAPFVALARAVAVVFDLATLALAARLAAALSSGDWRFGDAWIRALGSIGRRVAAGRRPPGHRAGTAAEGGGQGTATWRRPFDVGGGDTASSEGAHRDPDGGAWPSAGVDESGAAAALADPARPTGSPAPTASDARTATPRGARHITVQVIGALGALHPVWAVTGSQTLIDVPAAAALLAATSLSLSPTARPLALGAALAAAALVRIQLAPALVVLAAAALLRQTRAERLAPAPMTSPALGLPTATTLLQRARGAIGGGYARWLCVGGAVGALPFAALDAMTVGAPLQPLIRYVLFNAEAGQTAFGVMAPDHYLRHAHAALPSLLPAFVGLALVGARRQPALGLACLSFLMAHQVLPYRVFRFLHPGLWLLLLLAAVGAAHAAAALRRGLGDQARPPVRTRIALGGVALAALIATAEAWRDDAIWQTTWLWHHGGGETVERSRALNRAALALSAEPPPRVVVQAVLPAAAAPGHALFGHDVQILHPLGRSMPAAQVKSADAWILASDDLPALGPGARICRATFGAGVATCRASPRVSAPLPDSGGGSR